jgi:hypothetical protein
VYPVEQTQTSVPSVRVEQSPRVPHGFCEHVTGRATQSRSRLS